MKQGEQNLNSPEIAIQLACDAVGHLVEFMGFKSVLGRIWVLLFLSEEPLSASDISKRLGISSGLCSMSINELLRLDAIEKELPKRTRSTRYIPVTNLWKIGIRVVQDREERELTEAIESLKRALEILDREEGNEFIKRRIKELIFFLNGVRASFKAFRQTGMLNLKFIKKTLGYGEYIRQMEPHASKLLRHLLGGKNDGQQ